MAGFDLIGKRKMKGINCEKENVKKSLIDLYQENIPNLQKELSIYKGCNISSPLLIAPPDSYFLQENRLMIIGQQTCGWDNDSADLKKIINVYENFDFGKNKSTPFWDFFHNLEDKICGHESCSIWSNINRIDQNGKAPCETIVRIVKKYDFILQKEISILNPNFIIFLCGHSFDSRIQTLYTNLKIEKISEKFTTKYLAQYKCSDFNFVAIRTYHPAYLRRRKLEKEILEEITKFIKDFTSSKSPPITK